ncbi:hypothetical protein [Actinosynnema sp. NPDC023587]|uniref:hypothetical protein n=1 Tax=Actinosynnema sp. NPDC023587 TaxID=3154695 RepID=UPI0034106350
MAPARRCAPEARDAGPTDRPNVTGAVVGALGLAGLTGALVEAPVRGPDAVAVAVIVAAGVAGVAGLTAFVPLQPRGRDP